jgi:hypothetical protein
MAVDSVGLAVAAQGMARSGTAQASVRPVIDAQTIKTILYLGMKGDVSPARPEGQTSVPGQGGGVDTYA